MTVGHRFYAIAALLGVASPALAQQRERCEQVPLPNTHTALMQVNGQTQVFLGGGVEFRCPRSKIRLRGDSAEQYPDRYVVIGHVNYDEPRLKLTSDILNYYPVDERVFANGNVNATLPNGSTLVGPVVDYKRIIPRTRPRALMDAVGRPTIKVVQKDSAGRTLDPMTMVANQVKMDGDSLLYGGGQVTISRAEVLATGDSVFIDTGRETMRLMTNPRLEGKRGDPFTLTGDLIDLYSRNRKLDRVIARAKATATSKDMTLKADTIDLRVVNDLLDRAFAWGKTSRANAKSSTQNVVADSIAVTMPKQRVRLIKAYGKAFAETKADTVHFRAEAPDTTDWIRGDSIIAKFDTLPPKDTTKSPAMEQLFAGGGAKSLYHIAPNDTTLRRPAVSYVTAHRITLDFADSRVSTVSASDSVSGVYLDPSAETASTTRPPAGGRGASARPPTTTPPPSRPPAASQNGSTKPAVKSIVPLPPRRP